MVIVRNRSLGWELLFSEKNKVKGKEKTVFDFYKRTCAVMASKED